MKSLLIVLSLIFFIGCGKDSKDTPIPFDNTCVCYLDSLEVGDVFNDKYEYCLGEVSEYQSYDGSITYLTQTDSYNHDNGNWDYYFDIWIKEDKISKVYKIVNTYYNCKLTPTIETTTPEIDLPEIDLPKIDLPEIDLPEIPEYTYFENDFIELFNITDNYSNYEIFIKPNRFINENITVIYTIILRDNNPTYFDLYYNGVKVYTYVEINIFFNRIIGNVDYYYTYYKSLKNTYNQIYPDNFEKGRVGKPYKFEIKKNNIYTYYLGIYWNKYDNKWYRTSQDTGVIQHVIYNKTQVNFNCLGWGFEIWDLNPDLEIINTHQYGSLCGTKDYPNDSFYYQKYLEYINN